MTIRRRISACITSVILFLLFCPLSGQTQVYNLSDTTITACSGTIYDSGGPNGPYSNNESIVMSIQAGGVVTINFNQFSLHNSADTLFIFDSSEASGIPLHILTGSALPAPITAFSGAFTLIMQTDSLFFSSGFVITWTTDVPLPEAPSISVGSAPACNAAQLSLQVQPPISCDLLNSAYASIEYADTNVSVSGINGNCVGTTTGFITLNLAEQLKNKCDYIIQLHLFLPDACGDIREVVSETVLDFSAICPLDAQISASQSQICSGDCIELRATSNTCSPAIYSWSNGLLATPGPHLFCPDSTTTIILTVTDLNTLEVVTEEFVISVLPSAILNTPIELCQNAPAINLISSIPGTWSGPGVTGSVFDPSLAGPGDIEVFLSGPICEDSVIFSVRAISLSDQAACPNVQSFALSASPPGGVWSGSTLPNGFFPSSPPGSYPIYYEINGCIDSAFVNVAPIDVLNNIDSVCQSVESVILQATPTGGSWSGAGIVDPSGIFRPELALANSANTLVYSPAGCNTEFSIFVIGANVDSLVSVCPSQGPIVPDATPIPAGGTWSSLIPGLILDPTSGLINPLLLEGQSNANMIYNPGNGCFDTLHLQVSVTDIPSSYFGTCIGSENVLLDETTFPNLSPIEGIWSGSGVSGNSVQGYSFSSTALSQGEYTLTYSANGCTDEITIGVWLNSLPNTTVTLCVDDSPQELVPGLICATCTGPPASWQGPGIIDNALGIFDPSVSGPGEFYPVWANPGGCPDSIMVTVTETEPAVISGLSDYYCGGAQIVNFSATPEGGQLFGDITNFQFNTQSLSAGEYEVGYVSGNNCVTASPDTAIFIFEVLEPLEIDLETSTLTACYGDPISASATVSGGIPGGSFQYSWNIGSSSQSIITFLAQSDVTLTVTVDDGCSASASAQAEIATSPEIVFDIESSDTLCKGEPGFLRLLLNGAESYTVLWNNAPQENNEVNAPAGTEYAITVTDEIGCTKDSTVSVPYFTTGIASFSLANGAECLTFEERNGLQFLDLSADAISGIWNFGDSTTQDYLPGVGAIHSYADAGFYTATLSVESINGCSTSDSVVICIQPDEPIFIPDIFSPNADGKNDTLYVRGFLIKRMDFQIFNRWGELVFRTDNPSKGWAGDHRGMPAASGSYFYQLMVVVGERDKILRTGEIILVR